VLDSQHKGSNAPSVGRLAGDEETTRPGHWLGLVLCPGTPTVGWQEGYPARKIQLAWKMAIKWNQISK